MACREAPSRLRMPHTKTGGCPSSVHDRAREGTDGKKGAQHGFDVRRIPLSSRDPLPGPTFTIGKIATVQLHF